jgi:hypothetical protein
MWEKGGVKADDRPHLSIPELSRDSGWGAEVSDRLPCDDTGAGKIGLYLLNQAYWGFQ